jgi:hypothetical protein
MHASLVKGVTAEEGKRFCRICAKELCAQFINQLRGRELAREEAGTFNFFID